jgi:hypothetical protein
MMGGSKQHGWWMVAGTRQRAKNKASKVAAPSQAGAEKEGMKVVSVKLNFSRIKSKIGTSAMIFISNSRYATILIGVEAYSDWRPENNYKVRQLTEV